MIRTAFACLFVMGLCLSPRTVWACSCMLPPPPGEAADQSDAVFVGEVTAMDLQAASSGLQVVRVSFRVLGSLKGVDRTAVVYTNESSAACGYSFEEGDRYLVYAGQSNGQLHTGLCSRTKRLAQAAEDLKALNLQFEAEENPSCGGPSNTGMLQAALFTLVGFALVGRRI